MNLPYMDQEKGSEYESLPKHEFSRVLEIFLEAAFKKKSQIFAKTIFLNLFHSSTDLLGWQGLT